MRGDESKIPLGALIRKLENPAPINLVTPSDYMGIIDIMTHHCPHWEYDFSSQRMERSYFYSQDNHKVLKILLGIFRNTPAYTYIEKFERKRDGRGAYWALFDHYLGQHQVSHMVDKALLALEKARYTGETRNFNWEKYVNKHVENHNILDSMVGRGDFMGFSERQRINKLLEGIHCQPLEFMKATIWGQPDVYNTFHKASMLFGDYIQHNKNQPSLNYQDAKIGATQIKRGPGKAKKSLPRSSNHDLDRWITDEEWNELTLAQQNKARELSAIRQGKPSPPKLLEKTFKRVRKGGGKRKKGKDVKDKSSVAVGSTSLGDNNSKCHKSSKVVTKQNTSGTSSDGEDSE
jgi:hypothetical protein